MKSFLFLVLSVVISGSILVSCNEEVDLIGDFQETAVVYGLLDKSDTIHFIKINRAFIGPGNSLEIAQNPDSSYFNQVDATITEVLNGSQGRVWTLRDTLIDTKETNGVFYAPTQKVYYFATTTGSPLNDNGVYKLHISINGGKIEVDAQTAIVSGLSTSADSQNFRFDFADNPGSYLQKGIAVNVGNSQVVNTTLEVFFNEFRGATPTTKSFTWNLGESDITSFINGNKTFTVNGQIFYDLIKANVTADPTITKRNMQSIKVITTGGAEDLYNYMAVNQPSSSLAQSKPTYTNLSVNAGYRVIGIFSSRQTYTSEKLYTNPSNVNLRMMTQKSTIELCTGPITGSYLFCSQHVGDIGQTYHCN